VDREEDNRCKGPEIILKVGKRLVWLELRGNRKGIGSG
jgi:hypothetical protein